MGYMIGKKGILLTLGMIFLSLTILGFAEVILNNSESSESRIKEFSETERVYNLDNSVSKSIHRLMKNSMDDIINISIHKGNLTFNVTFLNDTYSNKKNVIDQLKIYGNRIGNYSFVEFGGKKSLFGKSEGIAANSTKFAESSRFYLNFDKNIYVEYITYPYNLIYFNGFDTENTKNINLTFRGSSNLGFEHFEGINDYYGGDDCINITFNFDSGGSLTSTESYGFKEHDSISNNTLLFRFNVTSVSGLNRTVALNWIEPYDILSKTFEITEGTSQGLAILLPDTESSAVGDTVFEEWYYGHPEEDLELSEDLYLEIQVFMEGEATSFTGGFMSQPMYNISLPLLDTNATGRRVRYID
jgi:hypothetical protein